MPAELIRGLAQGEEGTPTEADSAGPAGLLWGHPQHAAIFISRQF